MPVLIINCQDGAQVLARIRVRKFAERWRSTGSCANGWRGSRYMYRPSTESKYWQRADLGVMS